MWNNALVLICVTADFEMIGVPSGNGTADIDPAAESSCLRLPTLSPTDPTPFVATATLVALALTALEFEQRRRSRSILN